MSITSLSFTFVNTYAQQPARSAAAAERPAPAENVEKHSGCESRPPSRENRLVEAMMSALRELGLGGQAAEPAAAAATSTPAAAASTDADATAASSNAQANAAAALAQSAAATAAATESSVDSPAATEASAEPAVSLESAVRQFAHELFGALRQLGRGESSDQGSNRDRNRIGGEGDGGRRQHHGWRREGYGDMSQRLDALSQTFAAPAAVAAASAAPVSTSISFTLTVQNGAAGSPAEAVTTNAPVAGNAAMSDAAEASEAVAAVEAPADTSEAVPAMPAAPTRTTAQEVARNPLLDAFSQLFGALKPQAAQTDMADKLRMFLQTLAQAMRPDSMNGSAMSQVGALVNVTA